MSSKKKMTENKTPVAMTITAKKKLIKSATAKSSVTKKAAQKPAKAVVRQPVKKPAKPIASKAAKPAASKPVKPVASKPTKQIKPMKKATANAKKTPTKATVNTKKPPLTKTANKSAKMATNATSKKVVAKAQPSKAIPATIKKNTPIASSLMIKNNLAQLMPNYDDHDEIIAADYMAEAKKIHFRSLLTTWKQQLMQEVDRTVDYMKDEATNFPDPSDRATQEEEFSLELRTRDRKRKLINKIDEALGRLDNNEYGYCAACGVEIGYKRLEARPTATLCIYCKTIDEIRERQLAI